MDPATGRHRNWPRTIGELQSPAAFTCRRLHGHFWRPRAIWHPLPSTPQLKSSCAAAVACGNATRRPGPISAPSYQRRGIDSAASYAHGSDGKSSFNHRNWKGFDCEQELTPFPMSPPRHLSSPAAPQQTPRHGHNSPRHQSLSPQDRPDPNAHEQRMLGPAQLSPRQRIIYGRHCWSRSI